MSTAPDLSFARLMKHAARINHLAFVQEKLEEAGLQEGNVPELGDHLARLAQQTKFHKVFSLLSAVFMLLVYWAVVQTLLVSALANLQIAIPPTLNTLVLVLTPVGVPGAAITGIAKGMLDRDMRNTQMYCLGLVTAHAAARRD